MWPLQLLQLIACLEFTMRLLFYVIRDGSDHDDDGVNVLVNLT